MTADEHRLLEVLAGSADGSALLIASELHPRLAAPGRCRLEGRVCYRRKP